MVLTAQLSKSQFLVPERIRNFDPTKSAVFSDDVQGGMHQVVDKTARDAIEQDFRVVGMSVSWFESSFWVTKRYEGPGTLNVDWIDDANWTDIGALDSVFVTMTADTLFAIDALFLQGKKFDTLNIEGEFDGTRAVKTIPDLGDIYGSSTTGGFLDSAFFGNVFATIDINVADSLFEIGTNNSILTDGTTIVNDETSLSGGIVQRIFPDTLTVHSFGSGQSYSTNISFFPQQSADSTLTEQYHALQVGSISDTIRSDIKTLNSVYPFLFGTSANDLSGGGSDVYNQLTKAVEEKGNKAKTFTPASDVFLYYTYPASYGSLVKILDNSGLNVTGAFDRTTNDVTSLTLDENWTESYAIYKLANLTTISSDQAYTFLFSTDITFQTDNKLDKITTSDQSVASNVNFNQGVNIAGDVGIGTDSPFNKLDIIGSTTNERIQIENSNNVQGVLQVTDVVFIGSQSNHGVAFKSNNVERMRIDTVGNVGIGTISPGTALEVNGVINATTNLQESGVDISDIYEGVLGNPASDGFVLSSTTGGTRSWVSSSTEIEGTWTPAVSGVTVTNSRGYSQINGNMVTLIFSFTMPTTASGSTFSINNIPFASAVAGVGKPIAYYGQITKTASVIDNRLELAQNSSAMSAVSGSAPTGRTLAYFSEAIVVGSITYVKD